MPHQDAIPIAVVVVRQCDHTSYSLSPPIGVAVVVDGDDDDDDHLIQQLGLEMMAMMVVVMALVVVVVEVEEIILPVWWACLLEFYHHHHLDIADVEGDVESFRLYASPIDPNWFATSHKNSVAVAVAADDDGNGDLQYFDQYSVLDRIA